MFSDLIINIAKQNRNIMMSTLNAYHKEGEKHTFRQIKIILIPECSFFSKKMHTQLGSLVQKGFQKSEVVVIILLLK